VRLINGASGDSAAELVYLGLSVEARGRGLGRRLLLEGMREAAATGRRRLMLAVDEANAPALGLYRGLGFVNVSHKSAWILPLDEPDAGGGEVIHGRSPQVR
jgi:ribosomal-protein-alanine N-acetyltransferase